jgi:hypothetical protein
LSEVWIRFTYSYDGIEIDGVYATPEAAMGEWGNVGWKQDTNGDYIMQGSTSNHGDMIKRYEVQR